MLNEAPKKEKKNAEPTKWQYFWRIQGECLRRTITPFIMYFFMGMLAFASQAISPDQNTVLEMVLCILCIAVGAFFNGHLLYYVGKNHYGSFVAGEIHRKNLAFGIVSGSGHRSEREYRVWKGFLIGFYLALPAIILSLISGSLPAGQAWEAVQLVFVLLAGWAILPITFFGAGEGGVGLAASPYWALLMTLLPIIVSGIFYIVGAKVEAKNRARGAKRETAAENKKTEKGKRR